MLFLLTVLYVGPTALAATSANPSHTAQITTQELATSSDGSKTKPEVETVREQRIKKRLLTVALVGGVLLLWLAFGYGYLRLELTTRGFYSGRLQTAAVIASLLTLTVAYFLWRWLIN